MKNFLLNILANLAYHAAIMGAGSASLFLAYQPELPSKLQEITRVN